MATLSAVDCQREIIGSVNFQGAVLSKDLTDVAGRAEIKEVQPEKALSSYEFVFDLVTAFGTVVVAMLAIFGDRLRGWLSRPKIEFSIEKDPPYVGVVEEVPATSSSGGMPLLQRKIRLRITNKGRVSARAFSLQVDRVYRQKDRGNDFYKEALVPRPIPLKEIPFEDARTRMDLMPNYPLFVEIVEIRNKEILAQNTAGVVSPSPIPQIFIRIPHDSKGEFYCAGQGKIIFPIIFYSESLRHVERRYLEIFWTGADIESLSDNNFSVCLIDERKVKTIVGVL